MKRVLGLIVLLALAGGLAACMTPTVPPERASAIRSVALVSALGDEIHFQHVGLTVFTNDLQVSKPGWQLDEYVTELLRARLGARYEIKPLVYDKNPIVASEPLTVRGVRETVQRGSADAIVLVSPTAWGDVIYRTNQSIGGIGVFTRGFINEYQSGHAYAAYQITIIDGKSLEVIASQRATIPASQSVGRILANRPGALTGYTLPHRPAAFARKDRLENMAEADRDRLRNLLRELIAESLEYTLKELRLIE